MSYSLGNATVTSSPGSFSAVNSGIQGIIIGNQSGFTLQVQLEGGDSKTLSPGIADFFKWSPSFSGNIFWSSLPGFPNQQNYPISILTFDAVTKFDNINIASYPMSIAAVQAVSPTASGKPLFTASFSLSGALSGGQHLSIFNPANSGMIAIIHSARVFTTDTNTPTANLIYTGGDQNLSTSVPAVCHSGLVGGSGVAISVMHCTAQDLSGTFFVANQTVETINMPANTMYDMPVFPDAEYLPPGNGLILELSGTAQTKTIRLTLKWSEGVVAPPIMVTGAKAVASSIKNDGAVNSTQWLEVTPSGQASSSIQSTVDGQMTLNVLQSAIYHQFLRSQSSGNPLQLGQAGDISEVLGKLTVDQLLTASLGLTQTGALSSTGGAQTITGNANGALHLGTVATGDVLDTTVNGSNYDTHLKASGNVIVEVPSGTQVAKFANANLATILLGLLDIEQAAIGGVRNGSVAGTLTGFCPIWGAALKIFIATYNGYNSVNVQSFSFPSNPSRGLAFSGNMGGMTCSFFLSGVAQNVNAITALGTLAANGTFSASGTAIHAGDFIHFFTPADSIQFGSTAAGVVDGLFIFVGI